MQYTAMQNGIVLDRADKTKLRLQVYGDKVVRLSCCLDKFSEESSLMVCEKPWSDCFEVKENDGFIMFCTEQLHIKIDTKDSTIQYARRNRRYLVSQGRYGVALFPQKIEIPHYEKDSAAVGGMKLTDVEVKKGCRFSLRFNFSEKEPIYGFGNGTTGRRNRLEKEQYLYQYNYSAPAPFFCFSCGLWDFCGHLCL